MRVHACLKMERSCRYYCQTVLEFKTLKITKELQPSALLHCGIKVSFPTDCRGFNKQALFVYSTLSRLKIVHHIASELSKQLTLRTYLLLPP